MSNQKELYRRLCAKEENIPIFQQDWWLDATCGQHGWDVAIVSHEDVVHAALPYLKKRRWGFRVLSQPPLTPFLGPWLRSTGAKLAVDLGRQKDLLTDLANDLPKFDHYQQNWSSNCTNWLPFFWLGFKQTTKYTYKLEDLQDQASLWKGLRENIRREIRKAESRFNVTLDQDPQLEELLSLVDKTFDRQTLARPFTRQYIQEIDTACAKRSCRKILVARDADGRAHAGAYIVWDKASAYYLLGGGNPELRNSGATSFCMWEAIKFASGVTKAFDFEGSMIEPVERFFRAFGAKQRPYSHVFYTRSRGLRLALGLRSAWSGK